MRAIRVALGSSLVTEFLSGVSIGLVAMVVGFGLLGGHLSLLRALVAVLVTASSSPKCGDIGVEFHRREDAQRALDALHIRHAARRADSVARTTRRARASSPTPTPQVISLAVRAGDRVTCHGTLGRRARQRSCTRSSAGAARVPACTEATHVRRLRQSPRARCCRARCATISRSATALSDDELRDVLAALALRGRAFRRPRHRPAR